MPHYLFTGSFTTAEAVKGVLAEGGTGRRAAIEKAVVNLGGRLEGYYFTFGASDAIVIAELPDNSTAAAFSMAAGASGLVRVSTTPLISCDEMDATAKIAVGYTPPGG